jgi:hypothetical protein
MRDEEIKAYYDGQDMAKRDLKESVRLAKQNLGYKQDAVKDAQRQVKEAQKWVKEAEGDFKRDKPRNSYRNQWLASAWEKGFSDERNKVSVEQRPERIIGCNGHVIPQVTVKKIRKAKLEGRWGPGCERHDGCIGSCDWCEAKIKKA